MNNVPVTNGWVVNQNGTIRHSFFRITGTRAILTAAALTQQVTFGTLSAKWRVLAVRADVTTAFTGGTATAVTMSVDDQNVIGAYIPAADVFTAPVLLGANDIDLGLAISRATAVEGGFTASRTATRDLRATFTSTGDTLNHLTTGSVTFEVEYMAVL